LDELAALSDTAGLAVVGEASQRLDSAHPATLIGSGKLEEVRGAVADLGATVVVFDRELSPRQLRNVEQAVNKGATVDVKVVDRTALILDIFAQHAHTREGMLQVELAQYEYRLPRLTRLWTHLARQSGGRAGGATGGVGVRGPGETQLEIDRREIRRRIAALRVEIDDLRNQRRLVRERRHRAGMVVVALVGYTNAGKSTLLNRLTDSRVYTADQLFATLDPTTRRVALPSGRTALLTDTVGFIQHLPTQLVAAFRATLEEITAADVLLHVVDVTHPDAALQAETVERVLAEMDLTDPPMVVVANKVDLLAEDGSDEDRLAALRDLYPDLIAVSALSGAGLDRLLGAVDQELAAQLVPIEATIPYTDGAVMGLLHEHGVVESEEFVPAGTHVHARVPRFLLGTLSTYLAGPVPS
jgi:GTP-binding protein HflX